LYGAPLYGPFFRFPFGGNGTHVKGLSHAVFFKDAFYGENLDAQRSSILSTLNSWELRCALRSRWWLARQAKSDVIDPKRTLISLPMP
jgi:hypothetical protein